MDKKALNLPILISLVIGNMIGTGIYVLPAALAEYGSLSLLGWVLTSTGALFLALTFANLNKHTPKTGGPYAFCRAAFGDFIGFVVAYTYWGSIIVSVAGIAIATIGYVGFLTPAIDANSAGYNPVITLAVELAVVWFFTLVNIIGIHTAGMMQLFLTILKILPLIIISLIGLGSIHFANFSFDSAAHPSPLISIGNASALTFWAYIGLESATVPAENTIGYRDIFKATVLGTLITSLVYILSSTVLMGMIPVDQLKNSQFPFSDAATMLFGYNTAFVITLCAIVSGLGALNGTILVQGEVAFAAARDKLFPHKFANLSKHDVPIAAHCLSSTLVSLLLIGTMEPSLLKQFYNIALLASGLTLLTYFFSTLAEIRFKPTFSKPTLIAALSGCYALWMISSLGLKIVLMMIGILILCVPIYFLTVRRVIQKKTG